MKLLRMITMQLNKASNEAFNMLLAGISIFDFYDAIYLADK